MKFIEEHRERWGVEPICRVLQFAPATYYAARTRPASAKELWDRELKPEIQRIWNENFRVYGADQGMGPDAARGIPGGPLHGGAADAGSGAAWGGAGQNPADHAG